MDTKIITTPGIYHDLSFTEYRAQKDWLSVSDLNCFAQSAKNFKHRVIDGNRRESSKAQNIGSAVHCGFLEPSLYDEQFVAIDGDLRTTAGKAEKAKLEAERPGVTVLTRSDNEVVQGCIVALRQHALASKLVLWGKPEVSFFWIDPDTGIKLKGRADWLDEDNRVCPDLKTTKDALGFEKSVADFSYHRQAAHYLNGLRILTGNVYQWCWIAVGTEDPYLVKVWQPGEDDLVVGDRELKSYLKQLVECRKSGQYPGPPEVFHRATLPNWYKSRVLTSTLVNV